VTLAVVHWLYHLSLSLDLLGAAQAKVRSETYFSFPESFRFPLGNLFLLAPNTICKKYKLPFYFRIELVQGHYRICDHQTIPSKIISRFWLQVESKCKGAFSNQTGDSHCNETGIIK